MKGDPPRPELTGRFQGECVFVGGSYTKEGKSREVIFQRKG